jgi:Ulp1 family protease
LEKIFKNIKCFNSFFIKDDFDYAKKQSRWCKVSFFEKNILLIPIHIGGDHWTLVTIKPKMLVIEFYDPAGSADSTVIQVSIFKSLTMRYLMTLES